MISYIIRRLILVIPTLFGIMLINFVVIQAAPGGPIEQIVAQMQSRGDVMARIQSNQDDVIDSGNSRASRGLDEELLNELRQELGFDMPLPQRFLWTMWRFVTFDFGESFFRGRPVIDLIIERLPVSITLGIWTTLIAYLVSIPLGIHKAVRDGSRFDVWTSTVVIIGNAVPGFLFAILLIVLFAGGSYFQIFPLRGLVSDDFWELPWYGKVLDYLWHITLPVISMAIGSFAGLTMLVKNGFLDELAKQYVMTARAKGLTERRVLYGHVFRNAMLIVIAGFPGAFIGAFFTGSLLIETVFTLDGLGLLGFEAAIQRDYPVVFATLYIFTLLGLVLQIISDITYTLVDPRIDFESRRV